MFFPPSRNDIRGKIHGGRGGRSKVELTAQEELAKAREERERRKRQKLEQKSAVTIQAAWRGWSSRHATRRAARSTWIAQYGCDGEKLHAGDCLRINAGGALAHLIFFYRPDTDLQRLASVARVVTAAPKTEAFSSYVASYNVVDARPCLVYQLKALALQCLMTLSERSHDLAPLLAASRPPNPLDPSSCGAAGPLLECLMLLVSPEPFLAVLGKSHAASLAASVLSHLASHGMCGHLFHLLTTVLLPPTPHHYKHNQHQHHEHHHHHHHHQLHQHQPGSAAAGRHSVAVKPYVETLTTQLTVRLLALRSFRPTAPEDSLHMLLFVPDLWRRCGSLQPVSARLCRAALTWLAAAGPQRLADALQPPSHQLTTSLDGGGEIAGGGGGVPGGPGVAVAVLLVNVLAVGSRLLEADHPNSSRVGPAAAVAPAAASAAPHRGLALSVARVLHAVVSLLPLEPFFPDPAGVAGEGDSDDEVDEGACGSLGVARLVLQPSPGGAAAHLPAGLVEAVQGLVGPAGRQLLKQLVAALLPYTGPATVTATSSPPPPTLHGQPGHAAVAAATAAIVATTAPPLPGSSGSSSSPPVLVSHSQVLASATPPPMQRVSSSSLGYPSWVANPPPHPQQAGGARGPGPASQQHPGGAGVAASTALQPLSPPPSVYGGGSGSSAPLLEAAEAAHVLCELLWQLGQLRGQRQRVMLIAAVSCDLVERMWWSFLRPVRQAELSGVTWLPPGLGLAAPSAGGTAAGSSPGNSTPAAAPGSASSSYNCVGSVPMEVELPSAIMMATAVTAAAVQATAGTGVANTSGSGRVGGGAGSLGQVGAASAGMRYGSGCLLTTDGCVGGGGDCGGWRPRLEEDVGWLLPLAVTCAAFSAQVTTATLEEFYGEEQRPLPLQQLYDPTVPEAGFLAMLRDTLWQVLWSDAETDRSAAGNALYALLARTGGLLYGILYERNCRRAFCPTEAFHATALAPDWFFTEANSSRSHAGREDGSTRVWQVLRHAPYLVPFADRARLFQQVVGKERQEYRTQEDSRLLELQMEGALGHPTLGSRFVHIRRDRLLFDGFDNLNSLGDRLRGRVRIAFIDAHGVPEAGVDGGGLFKDFMEELMRSGLSAEYGLFASNSSHQLYPNPGAIRAVEDAPRLLAFLGQMLGKAMYENILLELPLAGFFLKQFRGGHCDLNDLPTLDTDLYRSLLRLRDHFALQSGGSGAPPPPPLNGGLQHRHHHGAGGTGGTADDLDLGLSFVVADDAAAALGDPHVEVELKPGGRDIPVTAENVNEYIHRVAHYKLNISPSPAVSAFLSGFYELIPRSWVSMFSGEELQTLISGAEQRLDLGDMRENMAYAGGYHEDHPVVQLFWQALESFSPDEQGRFLKFVTSCSRAPLLGFRYLEPKLCMQMSGGMLDPAAPQRLPTASTCLNLLKLPPYRTLEAMREKLLYAINSGAGFDLS